MELGWGARWAWKNVPRCTTCVWTPTCSSKLGLGINTWLLSFAVKRKSSWPHLLMNNIGVVSGEATMSKGWLWRLLLAKCVLPVRGKQRPRSLVSHKGRLYITVLREVILATGITNLGRQCSISNLAWQWLVKMIGWSNDRDVPMLVFRFSVWVGVSWFVNLCWNA